MASESSEADNRYVIWFETMPSGNLVYSEQPPWRVSGQFRRSQGNVRTARYHTVKRARKRSRILTCEKSVSTLRRFDDRRKEFLHEADVSAKHAPTEEDARLPGAHEDARWAEGAEAAARQGTQAAHRLTTEL